MLTDLSIRSLCHLIVTEAVAVDLIRIGPGGVHICMHEHFQKISAYGIIILRNDGIVALLTIRLTSCATTASGQVRSMIDCRDDLTDVSVRLLLACGCT